MATLPQVPLDDNLDMQYLKRKQDDVRRRRLRAAEPVDQPVAQEVGDPAQQPLAAQEPLPVESPTSIMGRIGADAVQVLGGARDAFVETMQSLNMVGNAMREAGIGPQGQLTVDIPEVPKAGTGEGDVIRSMSQFITGFIPAMKGVRAAGITGRITAPMVAGAVADFAAMDPDEPRMSNMINELVPALKNPVTEFLATNTDDTEAESRFKAALEGAGLGLLTDSAFHIFKAMRAGRITRSQATRAMREATERAERVVAEEATGEAVEQTPRQLADLTDEQIAKAVEEEIAASAARKEEILAATRDLISRVDAGEEDAINQALRGSSVTRAEDGSVALRRGQRLQRFNNAQEAAQDVLGRRIQRQAAQEPFDPQRALRGALGLQEGAPLPAEIEGAVLQRFGRERVSRQLVEITDVGRERAKQFVSLMESGEAEQFIGEGKRLRVNFDRVSTPDDVKKVIAATADIMREQAEQQARGTQTVAEMLNASQRSRFQNVADILDLDAGQALSPEDSLAVRQVWVSSANRLSQLATEVAEGNLDATDDFLRQFILHSNIHVQATGVRAEAGRALRVFGVDMPAADRQFVSELGRALEASNGVTPQRLAQMVASIPTPEQLAKEPFDPQRALRGALGLQEGAPLPAEIEGAVLQRFGRERVSRQLVEITDVGRERAKQFVSLMESGEAEQFIGEGKRLRVNFDRVSTPDDVKKVIAATADIMREQAEQQARGTQTVAEMLNASQRSRFQNVADILDLDAGQALSPEDSLAVRQVWVSSANRLSQLATEVAEGNLDATDDFLRQFILHSNIHVQATGVRAEAGRALRVFGVDMPAADRQFVSELGRALEASNGVTPQRLAQMVASIPTPEQLAKFVKDSEQTTIGDAVIEYWINSLLSGPQTQAANIIGNSITTLWAIPERQLASVMGGIRGGEAVQMMYSLKQGLADGFRLMRQSFKSGQPIFDPASKLEIDEARRAIKGETFGVGGNLGAAIDRFGDVITTPGRALMATDEFFKGINYRMELHAQAFRMATEEGLEGQELAERIAQIIDNPPDTIIETSRNFARYQTFTNELDESGAAFEQLGRATQKIREASQEFPPLKIALPFVRTPFNIFRYATERTPLGLFSRNVRKQAFSSGPEGAIARSKLAMGSMLMTTAVLLAGEGMISGRGPADPRLRKFKRDNDNWQPYSVRVGDTWIAYNRLDPMGSLLGMVADFSEMSGEMDQMSAERLSGMMMMSVWQNLTSKTYMRGMSEVINMLAPNSWAEPQNVGGPAERFFENLAGTVVPTLFAQTNRAFFDNTVRETHSAFDRICSRIPGCSDDLPPRLNMWAEPIVLEGGLGPDIISPIYVTTRQPDDVDREIIRLKVPLTMPPRAFASETRGVPIELTPQEYNRFIELQAGVGLESPSGERIPTLKEAMREVMRSSDYRGADDFLKSALLRELVYDPGIGYRVMARDQLRRELPELDARLRAKELGPGAQMLTPSQRRQIGLEDLTISR